MALAPVVRMAVLPTSLGRLQRVCQGAADPQRAVRDLSQKFAMLAWQSRYTPPHPPWHGVAAHPAPDWFALVHFTAHPQVATTAAGAAPFVPVAAAVLAGLQGVLLPIGVTAAASRARELRVVLQVAGAQVAVCVAPKGPAPAVTTVGRLAFGYAPEQTTAGPTTALWAARYVAKLAGNPAVAELLRVAMGGFDAAALHRARDVALVPVGQLPAFRPERCDGTARQPPRRLGPRHLVVLGEGAPQVWAPTTDDELASALVYAKNVVGFALQHTAQGTATLRLTANCAQCAQRYACAGCFIAQPPPQHMAWPALRPGVDQLWEPTHLLDRAGRAALAQRLRRLAPHGRVYVRGRMPTAVLDPAGDAPADPACAEPALIAAALRHTPLQLVDYTLPGRHHAAAWQLVYARDAAALPAPSHLTIVANRKCVTVCRYCNLPLRLLDNMALHDVLAVLEEVAVLGTIHVEFFGGEVTLRKDLLLVLDYARHLGMQCDVTTTGVGPDDALLHRLSQAGVADLSVSLDAADPAVHDHLKDREGIHAAAVHAARTLVAAGAPWVGVNTVVTRANFRGLPALLQLVADLGLRGATLFLCQPIAEIGHATPLLDAAEVLELLEHIMPACRALAAQHGLALALRPPLDREPGPLQATAHRVGNGIYNPLFASAKPCRVVDKLVAVQPSGDVRLCNQPIWQFEPAAVVGNLAEAALAAILLSTRAAAFRAQAGHFDLCRYCSFDHASAGP